MLDAVPTRTDMDAPIPVELPTNLKFSQLSGFSNSRTGGVAELNPEPPPFVIVTDVTIPADTFALPIVTMPELPRALTSIFVCNPTR